MTENLERISTIVRTQEILRKHDFTFKKKFGQNFLTDANILRKIVTAADITGANVLEIGPGIGSLTEYLLGDAAEVMAFEIDGTLVPILRETLAPYPNFQLVHADILKIALADYVKKFKNPELPLKVVANLPYYITTPILMHLIESGVPFAAFVVMMQKEVAERIAARPNTKVYGALSIAVQYYMTVELAFNVPRTVFVPAPRVDSAILKMTRLAQPAVAVSDDVWFFHVVKVAFAHRRKTLLNNFQLAFGAENKEKLLSALTEAEIEPVRRAESLTLQEFARLSDALLPLK
ncbi:MAG: 16S rRNA (adenine(1518)-N(6)/adenine(1519)-N(6))-dimethyltransferase RsmA [Streptococcaceae bacterium]|jgi:16S rRNA (adenine1518-N6/adenine1519-N6)-dimethyltransferase|nr:16S rRNA (adenine(1518)-N(6)/adenine(1519)-N(6))-dimethyltransferase RsmA [Streptococcaceae bacterium]